MKTPDQVVADITRRLTNNWHAHIAGDNPAFPHAFPLGRPTAADLKGDYAFFYARTVEWQDWAKTHSAVLTYTNRTAKGGTTQRVPTHVTIDSIGRAAAIVGGEWSARLLRASRRLSILRDRYPHISDMARTIRLIDKYSDLDFTLLTTVADWFLEDPIRAKTGVTPRQVPLPGVHAKWLQSHCAGVQALTGLENLGLLPPHPARIHFTYLDPAYRATGARIHDSATVGDSFVPAYSPRVVIISENKDTAIHFPEIPRGISVEGVGKGGKTPAAFPWLRNAPTVIYWGDIDSDGYEILNGYRTDFDRDIDSILMDPATYEAYEQFGTNYDKNGNLLTPASPKIVNRLRADEQALYVRVLDPAHTGHRRIEQERIPLDIALRETLTRCGSE